MELKDVDPPLPLAAQKALRPSGLQPGSGDSTVAVASIRIPTTTPTSTHFVFDVDLKTLNRHELPKEEITAISGHCS